MARKLKKLPVDKETHKLLNFDSLYYVPDDNLIIKKKEDVN